MNGFINNLIHRYTNTDGNVKPRVRGMFEPEVYSPRTLSGYDLSEHETSKEILPPLTAPAAGKFKAQSEEGLDTVTEPPTPKKSYANPYKGVEPSEKKDFKRGEDKPFGFSPSDDEPKEKLYQSTDPTTKPARRLFDEEFPLKNTQIPVAHHERDNTLNYRKEPGRKNYLVVSQENYRLDKNQPAFIKHTSDSSEETVKPAFVAGSASEGTDAQATRTGFQGLLGKPPGLRNSENVFNQNVKAESPPVIKVTIGRIDVRAVSQPISSTIRSKAAPVPKMSLEDYLNQRNKSR